MTTLPASRPDISLKQLQVVLEALNIHASVGTIIDLLIYLDLDFTFNVERVQVPRPLTQPERRDTPANVDDELSSMLSQSMEIGATSPTGSRISRSRQRGIEEGLAAANSWYCVLRGRKAGAIQGWATVHRLTHKYSGNLQWKCEDQEDAVRQFKKFWLKDQVRSGDGTYVGVVITEEDRRTKATITERATGLAIV
ncbi:hypothetical protein NMY22_g1346 [Coprinellus aureogranulatus]|nr:hypothetical protein NMY22_g1346 [Coprinellus aureogranulatus]